VETAKIEETLRLAKGWFKSFNRFAQFKPFKTFSNPNLGELCVAVYAHGGIE
jgi:hypothetical protein